MINRMRLQRGITLLLVMANLCLLVVYVGAWTNPRVQNKKKTISRWPTRLVYPVDITELKTKGKAVKADEEFDGDTDWLQNLTFKLKNKSDKTITYIVLDIDFPETRAVGDGSISQHQITLGRDPENKFGGTPLNFLPGESMEVPLAPEYNSIKTSLGRRLPLENVSNVLVRLHQVMFDDETLWSSGNLYRRNPDPNGYPKWIQINN
jgi:hypothetical protein